MQWNLPNVRNKLLSRYNATLLHKKLLKKGFQQKPLNWSWMCRIRLWQFEWNIKKELILCNFILLIILIKINTNVPNQLNYYKNGFISKLKRFESLDPLEGSSWHHSMGSWCQGL